MRFGEQRISTTWSLLPGLVGPLGSDSYHPFMSLDCQRSASRSVLELPVSVFCEHTQCTPKKLAELFPHTRDKRTVVLCAEVPAVFAWIVRITLIMLSAVCLVTLEKLDGEGFPTGVFRIRQPKQAPFILTSFVFSRSFNFRLRTLALLETSDIKSLSFTLCDSRLSNSTSMLAGICGWGSRL